MIYVVAHREFNEQIPGGCKNRRILHVGSGNIPGGAWLDDRTGDSISEKNKNYSELTGLYWIWKNGTETEEECTGLEHYRRYFIREDGQLADEMYLEKCLKEYDIILPRRIPLEESAEDQYRRYHRIEDLYLARNLICSENPEFLPAFETVLNRTELYAWNMIVCRKKLLDEYCAWLFPILFSLEKEIDITDYDEYQQRVFGFLAERLLNVWTEQKQLKVREMNFWWVDYQRENREQ